MVISGWVRCRHASSSRCRPTWRQQRSQGARHLQRPDRRRASLMAGHPYLLAAIGGLLAQLVMNLYSSGLNLHDLRVRLRRSRTIVIDGAVILLAGAFVMVVQADFSGSWRALSSCSGSKLAILARPGHQEARRRDWRR